MTEEASDPKRRLTLAVVFVTILIGIAGALIGGFIASALGLGAVTGFNVGSLVIATGGGLLLLFGYRKLKAR